MRARDDHRIDGAAVGRAPARGARRRLRAPLVFAALFMAAAAHATPPDAPGEAGQGAVTRTTPVAPLIPYPSRLTLSPADAAPAVGEDLSRATLAPAPEGTGGVDEVEIAPRPTLTLSSRATWEKGFEALAAAFRTLDEIALAAGFDVTGRPFAVFTHTEETGFRFDAMLPVHFTDGEDAAREALAQAAAEHALTPAGETPKTEETEAGEAATGAGDGGKADAPPVPEVRLGVSPSGRAFRFVHASAYDDIDGAYEAITTYLDSKNIIVQDAFIEEYVTDLTRPADDSLEVYIYVQPQEKTDQKSGGQGENTSGEKPAEAD